MMLVIACANFAYRHEGEEGKGDYRGKGSKREGKRVQGEREGERGEGGKGEGERSLS